MFFIVNTILCLDTETSVHLLPVLDSKVSIFSLPLKMGKTKPHLRIIILLQLGAIESISVSDLDTREAPKLLLPHAAGNSCAEHDMVKDSGNSVQVLYSSSCSQPVHQEARQGVDTERNLCATATVPG